MTSERNPIDALAQEIRRVDGNHSLGAGALAEALMPFLAATPPQGEAVAWRLRRVGVKVWNLWDLDPRVDSVAYADTAEWEVQPLYTAPAPVGEGVRQRIGDQCLRAGFAFWVGAEDKAVEKMADELLAARESLAALTPPAGGEG